MRVREELLPVQPVRDAGANAGTSFFPGKIDNQFHLIERLKGEEKNKNDRESHEGVDVEKRHGSIDRQLDPEWESVVVVVVDRG